jgi:hypothetical protein
MANKADLSERTDTERGSVGKWVVDRGIPVLTALVTVGGFVFAVNKYASDRAEERATRDAQQLRANMTELLQIPASPSQAVSRAVFLLADIDRLTANTPERRRGITTVLAEMLAHDCDFDKRAHVRLDIAALENWEDYSKYLHDSPASHGFLFYKYFQALRHLHAQEPAYFKTIKYDRDTGFVVDSFTVEERYLHFESLVRGFRRHLGLVQQRADSERVRRQFGEAIGNPALAEELFGSVTGSAPTPRRR